MCLKQRERMGSVGSDSDKETYLVGRKERLFFWVSWGVTDKLYGQLLKLKAFKSVLVVISKVFHH